MGQSPADVQKGLAEVGIGTKPAASEPTSLSTDEASTNFYWTVGETEIFNLQTTLRGNVDPAAVKRHLSNVKACLAGVVAVGGHAKAIGRQAEPMPAPNAVAPIPPAGAPVPPPPAPAQNGNGQSQESVCAIVEVSTSYTGNKPQLKFHVNGMDHPLSYTKEIGDMARLLAPLGFTAAHIVVGQKYPVACIVTWQQGEKYRNVLSVRKA